MPIPVSVGWFWVRPEVGPEMPAVALEEYCQRVNAFPLGHGIALEHDDKAYNVTDLEWDEDESVLTGIIWRVRSNKLPARLHDGKAGPLGIGEDDLGEAASFAYMPTKEKMVLEHNQLGPRQTIMADVLASLGVACPLVISPVPTKDAVQRMNNAPIIRRIEFSLEEGEMAASVEDAGPAVTSALKAMREVKGATISVEISMGHGVGSLDEAARAVADFLSHRKIRKLKAGIKETNDAGMEILDLMGGRMKSEIEVPEVNRQIDHARCCMMLKKLILE